MIERISLFLANHLASQLDRGQDQQEVFYYGLQIIIGSAVKLAVVSAVSLILGVFSPTMVAMGTAAAFRSITGGAHCTTYNRCLIAGGTVFVSLGWLARFWLPTRCHCWYISRQ